MAKYRKKPIVIEAIEWTGDNFNEVASMGDRVVTLVGEQLSIHTLEGDHLANRGDFIIKGVQGELYPCKPDIFEATYEKEV